MLESGDNLDVDILGDVDVSVGTMRFAEHHMSTLALDSFYSLAGKKPYVINLNKVECIVGEWNKDKTEYGLRICFISGNTVWIDEHASKDLFNHFKHKGGDGWLGNEFDITGAEFQFENQGK